MQEKALIDFIRVARKIYFLPLLLASVLVGILISPIFGHGKYYRPGSVIHRLFSWDGLWYKNVAVHNYVWQNDGWKIGHYTNLDFFPIYPIIEKLWSIPFGFSAFSMIFLSFVLGIISIFSVYRLAFKITNDQNRSISIAAIYTLWPASYCFFTGYPTGFINICAAEAILAWLNGKQWRAAAWVGLGTGTAPTMVFLAAAFCIDKSFQWLKKPKLSSVPAMFLFGLATVWGLLGFMSYLGIHFNDPILFLKAQRAWGAPTPFVTRLILVFNPLWYGLPIYEMIGAFLHGTTANTAEIIFQRVIDLASFLFFVLILWKSRKSSWRNNHKIPDILWLSALVSLIGYMWFLGTTAQNLTATIRLLYPVMLMFIWPICNSELKSKYMFWSLLGLGFVGTALQISLVISGYSVI